MFEALGSRHFVRTVLLAGEPVNVHEFEKLLESDEINFPRIFDLYYGNTETTIKELTRKDPTAGVLSPIGVPVEHAHALVLDEQRHPVPTEQHGELWIGGAGSWMASRSTATC